MEALFNEVTFSTYTRPGELLRVLPCDVVKKNQDYHFDVVFLCPHERGVSSKVGIYDDTVILDDTRAPWLGSLLVELAEKKEKISQETSIWSFSAAKYLETWRRAVQVLQIEDVAITPYQNRHGGASRDHLCRLRSMMAIQRRGRWASDASTRIYSKPGRLQQTMNQYSDRLKSFGEEVRLHFDDFYRNSSIRLPPGLKKRAKEVFPKGGF